MPRGGWPGQGVGKMEPRRSPQAPPRREVHFAVQCGLLTSWPGEREDDIGLGGIEPRPEESLPGYKPDSALTLAVYSAVLETPQPPLLGGQERKPGLGWTVKPRALPNLKTKGGEEAVDVADS